MRLFELTESLDKIVPYQWAHFANDTIQLYHADFQIGDGHFIVEFKEKYYERGYWELSFVRNGELDLSGTGSAGSVFATVMAITREFINDVDPRFIHFAAKNEEDSRNKLYPKLISRLQKEFPLYMQKEPKKTRTYTRYELERPKKELSNRSEEMAPEKPLSPEEWEELDAFMRELQSPSS